MDDLYELERRYRDRLEAERDKIAIAVGTLLRSRTDEWKAEFVAMREQMASYREEAETLRKANRRIQARLRDLEDQSRVADLQRQVTYLKAENQQLRDALPKLEAPKKPRAIAAGE